MADIPKAAREAVHRRSDGRCERCGTWGSNIHHRQPRGRGGTSSAAVHDLANLVELCGWGNASGCHGWVETHRTESYEQGWLVRSGENPADVPILRKGMWFLVTADELHFVGFQEREAPPADVHELLGELQ